jgi:mRNA interferase MazF
MSEKQLLRGDVVLVNLEPVIGHEIGRTRPAIVVQNDVGNRFSPTVIVVAITRYTPQKAKFPICAVLESGEGGLEKKSIANASQVRTVDKRRIVGGPLGRASAEAMEAVDRALRTSLALD